MCILAKSINMKKYLFQTLLIIMVASLVGINKVAAQSVPGDSIIAHFVKDWERAKAYTDEYLSAMPADKFSFKAHDSIRSFGQQMLHLAQANMFFIMNATGEKQTFGGRNLEKVASAQSADSVKYYVDKSYDYAINSIKKANASTLWETKTVNMGKTYKEPAMIWMMKAFEHQTHHRGQTTIYLRLAGVKPPQEKLF